MTQCFINCNDLKNNYIVYGSFYNIKCKNKLFHCRNLLEIYSTDFYDKNSTNNIHKNTPEEIFIMMNPGSSEPKDKNYVIPTFDNNCFLPKNIKNNELVATIPDKSQYQIMRLMNLKQWNHVRIINLSDIRQAKSKNFINEVLTLNDDIHTIFSKRRNKELETALKIHNNRIFAAWGRNKKLISLADKCLSALPNTHALKGVQYDKDDKRLYSHASPIRNDHKKTWFKKIQKVL